LGKHGLLGYYESKGFEVRHFLTTDYQQPQERLMEKMLIAYDELPKPGLLHCSAGIDRSAPVAAT
jgi:protein-tyrosine phosphatase